MRITAVSTIEKTRFIFIILVLRFEMLQMNKLRTYSTVSFTIFIVIIVKYILVNDLHLINPLAPSNRIISWLFILPLAIVGFVLSIKAVKHLPGPLASKFKTLDFYLAAPMLLFSFYLVVLIVYLVCCNLRREFIGNI